MQNNQNKGTVQNKDTTKKKSFKKTLLVVLFFIIVIEIIVFILLYVHHSSQKPVETLPTSDTEQVVSSSLAQVQTEPEEEVVEAINFEELIEINSDTIGYLTVPGTIIDYPVVKGIDNVKYLTTNFNGEYNVLGTVFADMFNSDTLQDPLTVLYGHYSSTGEFFTQLHRYSDANYFAENPDIYLSTPNGDYKYEIVAAFVNDNYSLLYDKDYNDKTQLQGFIDKMKNIPDANANLNLDNVSTNDTFLALSTCLNEQDSYEERFIVVAKLVE